MKITQYFKQAWQLLRENPTLSIISITGTALAICMIMVVVMTIQIENVDYPPEINRGRMLYVKYMNSKEKGTNNSNNGCLSYELAQAGFKNLKTPEAVSVISFSDPVLASSPGNKKAISYDNKLTDEAFWKVFDFSFIEGKPYTREDVAAGLHKVVITEKVAKEIYGTTAVVGQTMLLSYTEYTVSGVVKEVSTLATAAYSQIWTSLTPQKVTKMIGVTGNCQVYILAHSKNDFPKIRAEVEKLRLKFNDALKEREVSYLNQPDTQFVNAHRKWSNVGPDMKQVVIQYIIIILLLLLIPAINISSMTSSQMRKRMSEFGIRRAFGATKGNLASQILWESLLSTLLGGFLGFVLSCICSYTMKEMLYMNSRNAGLLGKSSIDLLALVNLHTFLYALLFCVALNLLSAAIPAYRVTRKTITSSILTK